MRAEVTSHPAAPHTAGRFARYDPWPTSAADPESWYAYDEVQRNLCLVPKSERLAGLTSLRLAGLKLKAASMLAALSLVAGLIAAAVVLPVAGIAGLAVRDTAKTFNSLPVPVLGQLPQRSEILDRSGHLIAYFYPSGGGSANNPIDRVPVTYDQIAPVMRQAIVAIEDSRYWQHGALDARGTGRALMSNLQHHAVQGGSTLAQQYIKNALELTATTPQQYQDAHSENTVRKLRELRMAAIVEHQLTRKQLLAAYLSAAYFENQAYGIQVAAERYFSTTALHLTLGQSAMLAGIVEYPSAYNPVLYPQAALQRRNVVLARMRQLHDITLAQAQAAEAAPLGLHMHNTALQSGCVSQSARQAAYFCDYVLAVMKDDPAYAKAYAALNGTGGIQIWTTMAPVDQRAAQNAVTYMVPPPPSAYNQARNAAAEVLIQPGTGKIRAIAVDRPYGYGAGHNTVDYAVDSRYNGGEGVQTGSSSKLFTLLTALKQGYPFGFNMKVTSPSTLTGYTNCKGQQTAPYLVNNAEGASAKPQVFTLYNGTTQSINVFFAMLEQKVGLCNVVKTAASLGVHRADGRSLFQTVGNPARGGQYRADDIPSFTLGSINVSPMTMAAAYATVAARGVYCRPIAIQQILTSTGAHLPVKSASCHRVLSPEIADAANYILQGVLTSGTGVGDGISVPAAGKTGTANLFEYVAFAGYTPRLAGYVSMFNPRGPITHPMSGVPGSCYRLSSGAPFCAGSMFGANAGQIWQLTFQHAALGWPPANFVPVPPGSPFFSLGDGVNSPKPPKPPKPPKAPGGNGGGGHGHGGGGHGHRP
jgi:membrane peptidoglycan carboxypeptidase